MRRNIGTLDISEKPIVIFLDVDGVLLPFPSASKSSCGALFPDQCLASLSEILDSHPKTKLVLSSTWRARKDLIEEILKSFEIYGAAFGGPLASIKDFFDITDQNFHSERQQEIYRYLYSKKNKSCVSKAERIAAWVVLDDEELLEGVVNSNYRNQFEGHVVKVNSRTGLTPNDATLAIKLVREQCGA